MLLLQRFHHAHAFHQARKRRWERNFVSVICGSNEGVLALAEGEEKNQDGTGIEWWFYHSEIGRSSMICNMTISIVDSHHSHHQNTCKTSQEKMD